MNSALKILHLNSNAITDAGAEALAEALQTNAAIVELNLAGNAGGKPHRLRAQSALPIVLKRVSQAWANHQPLTHSHSVRS